MAEPNDRRSESLGQIILQQTPGRLAVAGGAGVVSGVALVVWTTGWLFGLLAFVFGAFFLYLSLIARRGRFWKPPEGG